MSVKSDLSTVDTTKTTTSTSTKPAATRRPARVTNQVSVIQQAAAFWAGMTGDEKSSYALASSAMADALEPTRPPRENAYSAFVSLSAANLAADQPLQATASPFAQAIPLPPMQLVATYVNKKLTLTLLPNTPYPHPVAFKGARASLVGSNSYTASSFKKIGSLPSLSGPTDITDIYQSRYRVPGTGYKVAIEVFGVAPGGYHTNGLYVFGVVSANAAEAALTDPAASTGEPLTLKAA